MFAPIGGLSLGHFPFMELCTIFLLVLGSRKGNIHQSAADLVILNLS